MIFITHIFNLPLLILIWLIEVYLFLAAARLILAKIPSARQTRFYRQVKLLTDPFPNFVSQSLAKWSHASMPSWLAWVIVILLGCFVRQILVWMVLM